MPYSENAFWIKASFVGYKSEQVKIEKSKLVYTIRLVPEAKMLKDVLVRNSPVANLNGDTISYRDYLNSRTSLGLGIGTIKEYTIGLPGKILEKIDDKYTVLEYTIKQLKCCKKIDKIITRN